MKDSDRPTAGSTTLSGPRDLSQGVIVVLSGGPFDLMNPVEVRDRMDQLIREVNADPYVLTNSGGRGLTFKLLPDQQLNHIHQSRWNDICGVLKGLKASPLILIGHSNGGAAVLDLARCLGMPVDFAFTADSVFTLIDNGDANTVPSNIKLNLNPHVIPTDLWWEAPFPFGRTNHREDDSLDGILNIGLPFHEGLAWAHRDAFYDLAGGDQKSGGDYSYPELIRDTTLAVLKGADSGEVFQLAQNYLQVLANEIRIPIDFETADLVTTLEPAGAAAPVRSQRLSPSTAEDLNKSMNDIERIRLSMRTPEA